MLILPQPRKDKFVDVIRDIEYDMAGQCFKKDKQKIVDELINTHKVNCVIMYGPVKQNDHGGSSGPGDIWSVHRGDVTCREEYAFKHQPATYAYLLAAGPDMQKITGTIIRKVGQVENPITHNLHSIVIAGTGYVKKAAVKVTGFLKNLFG